MLVHNIPVTNLLSETSSMKFIAVAGENEGCHLQQKK